MYLLVCLEMAVAYCGTCQFFVCLCVASDLMTITFSTLSKNKHKDHVFMSKSVFFYRIGFSYQIISFYQTKVEEELAQ